MNRIRPLPVVALSVLAVVALADPAAADPAKPTDYRSEVTSVEPPSDAIDVQVVGGDSFLQLEVEPGHEVVVLGYPRPGGEEPEPYLRIEPDGTVSQNLRSPATYLNEDRYGVIAPEGLSPEDPPEWEVIDDDGEHTWHDHRIHWMSTERPPQASPGDVIFDDWNVELLVDGEPVVVHGTLVWEEGTSPLAWIAGAAVVAAAVVVAGRRQTMTAAGAALLVAAVAATAVGAAEQAAIPEGAGGSPFPVVIPALAVVAALVTLWRRHGGIGAVAALAGVALLAGWAMLRFSALLEPVLPTELDPNLDRAGTALALGVAVAAAVLVVRSGALRLPELADDEE